MNEIGDENLYVESIIAQIRYEKIHIYTFINKWRLVGFFEKSFQIGTIEVILINQFSASIVTSTNS